tara:strand:- start:10181 stop:10369 length:189 start_codon:yes stop_codon:yes gene_type:complete
MPTLKTVSIDKNGYIKVIEKEPEVKPSEIFEGIKDKKKKPKKKPTKKKPKKKPKKKNDCGCK